MCPNFGLPALTLSFTKYDFLQVKNSFAIFGYVQSVLKLFQLSNGDLLFSYYAYSTYKVNKTRMTKLGQGVEVRTHYPTLFNGALLTSSEQFSKPGTIALYIRGLQYLLKYLIV